MTEFTPLSALAGGAILGLSALLLLLVNGRIAGVSGILSKIIKPTSEDNWSWFFLIGLILGPLVASLFGSNLPQSIDIGWPLLLVGGFLVGVGSRLGSGCTSGHGICGIGRLSMRSIVATCVFMFVAIVVVFILRHLIGA